MFRYHDPVMENLPNDANPIPIFSPHDALIWLLKKELWNPEVINVVTAILERRDRRTGGRAAADKGIKSNQASEDGPAAL